MNYGFLIVLGIIIIGIAFMSLVLFVDSRQKQRELDKAEKAIPNYKKIRKLKELQNKYYKDMQLCIEKIKNSTDKRDIEQYEQLRRDIIHKMNDIEDKIIELKNG